MIQVSVKIVAVTISSVFALLAIVMAVLVMRGIPKTSVARELGWPFIAATLFAYVATVTGATSRIINAPTGEISIVSAIIATALMYYSIRAAYRIFIIEKKALL